MTTTQLETFEGRDMVKGETRLVVVSNRVPPSWVAGAQQGESQASVGGLVSALRPALEELGGLWFGWSGNSTARGLRPSPQVSTLGQVKLATVDLSEEDVSLYYTGFANRTLWPLLHCFLGRVVIRRDTYRAYRRINRRFAEALYPLLQPGDLVWVQDYHLFHIGEELRRLGWNGRLGFFLHVPFPPADIFAILPWAGELLEALLHYDLVGVHTQRYLKNLKDTLQAELGGTLEGDTCARGEMSVRLGVYPIGIEPALFQSPPGQARYSPSQQVLRHVSPWHQVVLGVDRLDYTKGIPERLRAFARLLEHNPSLRGKVTFIQVSSPSRTRVPEYIAEKEHVDRLVGDINGRFSEAGWVPVRYLYRSYPQEDLVRFYRDADVCMVTPLRDGMNLVAKEFVAAQGDNPGVLVLSRFSGAADMMRDALLVNPYDIESTAEALYEALHMPLSERRQRWQALMEVVTRYTAHTWRDSFLGDLAAA